MCVCILSFLGGSVLTLLKQEETLSVHKKIQNHM